MKILLLGSGELGKEFVIAAQRIGQTVIAVDNYENAPAMQVAHGFEVINMLDGEALDRVVAKHTPDFIVPEIEAIRTERFYDYEKQGITVVPSAKAANFTMNRKAIRDLAAKELGLKTANYRYATTAEELRKAVAEVGIPCVVKPLMSSSGKGQSTIKSEDERKVMGICCCRFPRRCCRGNCGGFCQIQFRNHLTYCYSKQQPHFILCSYRSPSGTRRLSGKLAACPNFGQRFIRSSGYGRKSNRSLRRSRTFWR